MASLLFWLCVLLIFYSYAGYPLLLGIVARLKKQPDFGKQPPDLPTITMVIAAYNEEDVIAAKLENSLRLDYPPGCLEIVVAADGSNDRTVEIVQAFAERGVRLSYAPERRGKMAALNHAMEAVNSEIVVFSDANNMYEAGALRELVAPFGDRTVGGVSGAKLIRAGDGALGDSEGAYWKYESWIKKQETRLGTMTGSSGEILAIRRALFEPAPQGIINDDFYLAMRLVRRGWRVVYAPRARSFERVSAGLRDEAARRARIVAGRYQAMALAGKLLSWRQPLVLWQVISHKFLRPLVPMAMIGALAANAWVVFFPPAHGRADLLRLAPPFGALVLAAQGLFYLAAVAGRWLSLPGKAGRLLFLAVFLLDSNIAALVGLWRYLRRRETSLWQRVQRRSE